MPRIKKYMDNYNNPNAQKYPKVEYPGRVVRDFYTGPPIQETTSIKRYFEKIGVDQFYTPGSTDPEMFKRVQYVQDFGGYQTPYDPYYRATIVR